jgi:hypothetical protein
MSSVSSASKAPPAPVVRPIQAKDADGDHDGTRAAAATAKPAQTPLATTGSVGRHVNTVA